ncbi:ATP-binding cassette domain-containing protein, partial [Streptomyces mirabilis]|uniref:ATP-binding cassette domain-containing protein n=1 Tax=Streptomyces mirabilis TaxID=68239 RepID=UPI0036777FFB
MSFSVSPGEVFGFVGSNGAGKTTTMRIGGGGGGAPPPRGGGGGPPPPPAKHTPRGGNRGTRAPG